MLGTLSNRHGGSNTKESLVRRTATRTGALLTHLGMNIRIFHFIIIFLRYKDVVVTSIFLGNDSCKFLLTALEPFIGHH